MSSQQARLTLRPPPHRQFIQGYPGIPAGPGRTAAQIAGSVEVRLGGKGLKASWLRIELRKIESTATENWGELIGRGPIEVWSAEGSADHDEEGDWDLLQTADFPFRIAIPEGLPPSIRLDKQSGISYEMVTSLCVKAKKGLIRKDTTSNVIQSTHPIVLEKHELHSTWPIYHIPDDHEESANDVYARIYRKQTCYGPGDKVEVRIILTSKNVSPVKIKTVALSIRETVTFRGSKRGSRMLGGVTKTANQKSDTIAQKAQQVNSKIYKGDTKTYDIVLVIPKTHSLMTIQTAKHIEISYTMRVYVDSKQPIIIDHLPLTITTTPASISGKLVPQIGWVPGLSAPHGPQLSEEFADQIRRPQSAGPFGSSSQHPSDLRGRSEANQVCRPTHLRSLSFASTGERSNTSTERASGATNIHRRDTMMTTSTASGPGLAGRGIPGSIFSWGQYGAAQPYAPFGHGQGQVRGAFAGPPSIYEGRELAPEENRALYHHSLANNLGEVFEGQAILPSVNVDLPAPPRASAPTPMSSVPESVEQHAMRSPQQSPYLDRPDWNHTVSSSQAAPALSAAQAAEMEKERLYRRAREQAERNQRRAAEAAEASLRGDRSDFSSPLLSPDSREQKQHLQAIAQRQRALNEKQILYQRARRQAEQYQGQFEQGADFPVEDLTPDTGTPRSRSVASIGTNDSHGANAALGTTAMLALASESRSISPEVQISGGPSFSGNPSRAPSATGFASAEEEKRKLYEAAMAERDLYLTNQSGGSRRGSSSALAASGTQSSLLQPVSDVQNRPGISSPSPSSFPTAEEEKRRFAAAKAQTDAYLQKSGQASQAPTASIAPGPSSSTGVTQSAKSLQTNGTINYPTAEDEKRRLYETAKAQADAYNSSIPPATRSVSAGAASMGGSESVVQGTALPGYSGGSQGSYASAEAEKRQLYDRAKAEVEGNIATSSKSTNLATSSRVVAPPTTLQAEDEKAQLRRFYEAQDAVARHHRGGSSSSAQTVTAKSGSGPTITRPEAEYASGYRSSLNGAISGSSGGSPSLIPNPYDQSTSGSNVTNGSSGNNTFPSSSSSSSSMGGLSSPTISKTGHHQQHPHPHPPVLLPTSGIYAPRVASANWHEEEDLEDLNGKQGKRMSEAARPPIPPKTPLAGRRVT